MCVCNVFSSKMSQELHNPLVPKHRKHYQKFFIFHSDTSFGELNRKQGLNLCNGQRLLRLACSIYATLGIKFSNKFFSG